MLLLSHVAFILTLLTLSVQLYEKLTISTFMSLIVINNKNNSPIEGRYLELDDLAYWAFSQQANTDLGRYFLLFFYIKTNMYTANDQPIKQVQRPIGSFLADPITSLTGLVPPLPICPFCCSCDMKMVRYGGRLCQLMEQSEQEGV